MTAKSPQPRKQTRVSFTPAAFERFEVVHLQQSNHSGRVITQRALINGLLTLAEEHPEALAELIRERGEGE